MNKKKKFSQNHYFSCKIFTAKILYSVLIFWWRKTYTSLDSNGKIDMYNLNVSVSTHFDSNMYDGLNNQAKQKQTEELAVWKGQ